MACQPGTESNVDVMLSVNDYKKNLDSATCSHVDFCTMDIRGWPAAFMTHLFVLKFASRKMGHLLACSFFRA